jgi:hypothetical protein
MIDEAKLKDIENRWSVTPDAPGRKDIDALVAETKRLTNGLETLKETIALLIGDRWEIPLPGNAKAELQAPRPMTRAQYNTLMSVLKGMEAGLVEGLEIVGPPKS